MRAALRRLTLALVGVAGLAGAAWTAPPANAQPLGARQEAPPAKFTAPEYLMGDPRAKVTVIEYASASCPHCARFDAEIFPAFKAKYVDTGKVRYVFREFLTPPEQIAAAGFLLARCAGEQRYFHVVEQVFAAQPQIYASDNPKSVFVRIAKENGLDEKQLDACLDDKASIDALNARMDQAVKVQKINGTPTFLIDGKVLDEHGHEPNLALFDAALQPLLAKR